MRVVFVRHGESTSNAGMPTFDRSKSELTAAGRAQAARLAAGWEAAPTLIAVSPYLRTHLTAQPTIDRFPTAPTQTLPMEEFTYLEPSRWNGTSQEERLPHAEAYWRAGDPAYRDGPGAESFDALLARVDTTLRMLQELQQGSLVYAFSHGHFMQALRISLLNALRTSKEKMTLVWTFNAKFPILNGDKIEVGYASGRWSVSQIE